jgi:hypothetical protein
MPWHWLALCSQPPGDAFAIGELHTLGSDPAGFIAAWHADRRRPPGALGVDVRAIDPSGGAGWISLALVPTGVRILFDDPAVSWALQAVLAGPPVRAMSTLTADSAAIGGALTAYDACPSVHQSDDPFARLFPNRVLHVGPGFIGSMHPPTGPGIQRYSGSPWPWSAFDASARTQAL